MNRLNIELERHDEHSFQDVQGTKSKSDQTTSINKNSTFNTYDELCSSSACAIQTNESSNDVIIKNRSAASLRRNFSFKSNNDISSSFAGTIQTIEAPNDSIIKNRSALNPWSVAKVLMVTLLALELWARKMDNPNLALSTRLLSISFWSTLAPFGSIAVRLAPIPTIMRIRKLGVGALPLLPYSSMANLAFVDFMYGVTTSNPKIIITFGIGTVIALYHCVQYLRHCPEDAQHLPGTAKIHKLVSLGIVFFTLSSITLLENETASLIVGITSVILTCAMYISPLCLIVKVIKEKSAKDIPLPFAVVGLINTFSWVIYGFFVKDDLVLWLPCAIGVLSTSAQIFLNALWGEGERKVVNTVMTV